MSDLALSIKSPILIAQDEWEPIVRLVIDSLDSPHSKRVYSAALRDFLAWWNEQGRPPFCKALVMSYRERLRRSGLASSSINLKLVAIRRLAAEAMDNNLLAPDIAGGISRIKSVKSRGARTGNWLDKSQAERLLSSPDRATLEGKRDYAILALLLGGGLRRAEAVDLNLCQLQQREGRWILADLQGKGSKTRTVCLPDWVADAIHEWIKIAGIERGYILRGFTSRHKTAVFTGRMTTQSLYNAVEKYSDLLGLGIKPHDLRRTHARLAYKNGCPLDQIQVGLGHSSIVTTQRYLKVEIDLERAACDYLGLER